MYGAAICRRLRESERERRKEYLQSAAFTRVQIAKINHTRGIIVSGDPIEMASRPRGWETLCYAIVCLFIKFSLCLLFNKYSITLHTTCRDR